ncbi:hypothetical protein LJC57_10205, partial [Parabacteroides sp. OttesenSCG-928-G07]|nr:hypothetical protein [Parabacteroides sp. OttesenSCG-928-G07]
MRTTKAFLCLLAVVLLAACNDYDGEDPTPPSGKRELTFTFPNTATSSVAYAIATPNENELRTVDVYVFALDELSTENPQPYLLEDIHQSGIGDFNLLQVMASKTATISLAKGDKKKFFFVGNGRDHVSAKDVTLNVTRADDFLKKVTKIQQGHIASPLLMSDLIDMPDVDDIVKNQGGKATVELTRRMVRFDVFNNADESDFIIEEIRIKNARAAVNLFADATPPYDAPFMDDDLSVDFTLHAGANTGLSNSVFYIYPTVDAGETTLELIGKDVSTGNPQVYPVTMQDKQGSGGTPFNILANSRYMINVLSKGISYLEATLVPEEWGYDPDNDVPVVADYGIIKLRDENGDEFLNNGIATQAEPTIDAPTMVKVAAESEWEIYIAPEYADWIGVTALQSGEIHDEFEVWTKLANPSGTDVREGVVEVRNKIRPSIMQPFIIRQAKNDDRSISYSGAFISNGTLSISGEIVKPVTVEVKVSDSRPWTAEAIKFKADDPDMDWIDLDGKTYAQQTGPVTGDGKLLVALHANPADTVRQAYIKITQEAQGDEKGDLICKIPVYQSPSNLGTIRLDAAGLKDGTLSVAAAGFSDRDDKRNIRVFAHTEWKVETNDSWIHISDKIFENGYNGSFKVSVDRHLDTNADRTGEIKVTNTVNS